MKLILNLNETKIKNFVRSGLWMSIRQFFILTIGIIFTIIFARISTKEIYGQYQLVLSILATISFVSISGLNASVLQAVARGFDGVYQKAVRISFKWSILLGTPILLIIGVYYCYQKQTSIGISLFLASLFFPLLYSTNTWESFVQGKERFDLFSKYSIYKTSLNTLLLILVLLIFKNNLIVLMLVYFITISLSNYIFYIKTKKLIQNKKEDKETIKYGWFLTKISILNSLFSKADYLIIGHFMGMESLAIYSIGIAFGTKIKDMFKAIFLILNPRIAQKGFGKKNNYIFIFIIFSFLAGILYLTMPFLIKTLFSNKYYESIKIAQIFILFLPVFITTLFIENHLILFSKNKKTIIFANFFSPLVKFFLIISFFSFGLNGLTIINGAYPAIKIFLIFIGLKLLKF